jgi:hypothetical protein
MQKLSLKIAGSAAFGLCLLTAIGLVAIKVVGPGMGMRASSEPSGESYPVSRLIQYGFTLQNETNRLIEKAELWTYAPVKKTATQRCDGVRASHAYDLIEDELGNQVLHFTFDGLPPYSTRIVTIEADVSLSDRSNRLAAQTTDRFLRPEKYIESDAPGVLSLARSLSAPKVDRTVDNVFRWVSENIRYAGYMRNDRGALHALRSREGDCTEYMYLFSALCRASGIPARGVGGFICGGDRILRARDYHNWAEFFHDGVWQLADPQQKVLMQNGSHYIAMRMLGDSAGNPMGDHHRFRYSGDGIKVKWNG